MVIDLILVSSLLVAAHLLRAAVPWTNRVLAPTPILAGVVGLLLGPQMLGLLPFSTTSDGSQLAIGQWPGVLIVVVFSTLLMGRRAAGLASAERIRDVRDTLFYNLATEVGQYGLAILLGVGLLHALFAGLPPQFPVMLASGFAGGHGTAAIFGQGFADRWPDAQSIGFAFATIGLLASIFGGVILLNLGARRGWAQPDDGVEPNQPTVEPEKPTIDRRSAREELAGAVGLEPLSWHLALVVVVYGLTIGVDAAIHRLFPGDYWLPGFALAMLIGAGVQQLLNAVRLGGLVDPVAMRRTGAVAADFLVVCGVASIKLSVVRQFAGPILVMSIFGVVYAVAVFFLGRRLFREYWFERSIFTYGWNTGTLGVSIALLRTIDPLQRSATLQEYGAAYLVIGPVEMLLYPAIIWAFAAGQIVAAGLLLTAAAVAMFVAARRTGGATLPAATLAAERLIRAQPTHLS